MALIIGKASAVTTSTEGGRTIDSVSLNSDGSVTKDGKTIAAGSGDAFNNTAGSSFKSRQTEGSSFSIGFDCALIRGFSVEIGLVNDAVGETDFFY